MREISAFSYLNSASFENLIVDLFNSKENTNTYSKLGRSGQKQSGIDIFSDKKKTVIQCKFRDDLNSTSSIRLSLKNELQKDVANASESAIDFEHFILVSTYRHDAELQHFAITLRDKNDYGFAISYMGWDEIRRLLLQFPEIYKRYFKDFDLPSSPIELVSIGVDTENCSWEPLPNLDNVFYGNKTGKSKFPVFDFSFINHTNRTVLLKSIKLFVKDLYSGLSGIPTPCLLDSSHTYQIKFNSNEQAVLLTKPPLEIPKEQAFRFKMETVQEFNGEPHPITRRKVFYFEFEFSSGIKISAPKVYLNTKDDSNSIPLLILT